MKKIIILIVGLIVCGTLITAYYLYNKPHKDIASANVDYTVPARQLYAQYENNGQKANSKYLNKILVTHGIVAQIKRDSTITIMLETGDMVGYVACELDEYSEHGDISIEKGDKVTMKGIMAGKLIDVILIRCIILDEK